jgi:hypothetical membrane protein
MLTTTRPHTSLSRRIGVVGGFAAVVAPVLMWLEFIGAGTSTPGYNLLTRAASDLGERGAATAAAYVPGFFYVPGALAVLVGLGLLATWKGGIAWRVGALLVVTEGVFLMLAGAFAEDPHSIAATSVHQGLAGVCFVAGALAPLALVFARPKTSGPRPPIRLWLLTGGALVAIYLSAILLSVVGVHFPQGLLQRPFTVVLTGWYLVTGIWMLRAAVEQSRSTGYEPLRTLEFQPERTQG